MSNEQEQLGINFETGEVLRGETKLMNLEEMLFLIASAVKYNQMFPIEQSEKFVADLREQIGIGFTLEQFKEIKTTMESLRGDQED